MAWHWKPAICEEIDLSYTIEFSESWNYGERLACEMRLLLASSVLLSMNNHRDTDNLHTEGFCFRLNEDCDPK